MKKIKELAITDKNGNVGYIDLTEIDSNKTNISSLQNRVKALEDGDFQYADKDYSNPENYSDMVIGTYYMVPFNENNEYVSIDSEDLHHFDVLVRTSRTENPKKIRTQYVQANIKDFAYTNKDNTFTGDNYFSGSLKVSKFSTDAITKDVTTTDLENTKSVTVELNQTDFTETDSEGHKITYTKNLAQVNVEANSDVQKSELTVENKQFRLGIKSSEKGVQSYAPIPDLETSSDDEIATVSVVRDLKTELKSKIDTLADSETVNTELNSLKTKIEINKIDISDLKNNISSLSNADIDLDSRISENSNKIAELQSSDSLLDSRISENSNKIVDLQGSDSLLDSKISENSNKIVELQSSDSLLDTRISENSNKITDLESRATSAANKISDLYSKFQSRIQIITNEEDAITEDVIYFLVDEIPPTPPQPEQPEQPTDPSEPTDPEDSENQ